MGSYEPLEPHLATGVNTLYTVVPYYDSNIFFSHKIRMYGNLWIENEIQWKKSSSSSLIKALNTIFTSNKNKTQGKQKCAMNMSKVSKNYICRLEGLHEALTIPESFGLFDF